MMIVGCGDTKRGLLCKVNMDADALNKGGNKSGIKGGDNKERWRGDRDRGIWAERGGRAPVVQRTVVGGMDPQGTTPRQAIALSTPSPSLLLVPRRPQWPASTPSSTPRRRTGPTPASNSPRRITRSAHDLLTSPTPTTPPSPAPAPSTSTQPPTTTVTTVTTTTTPTASAGGSPSPDVELDPHDDRATSSEPTYYQNDLIPRAHPKHDNCPDTLDCLPDTDGRPQHTLPVILRCAILGSPKQRLTIREIYAAMEKKYSYYTTAGPAWKVSVS